MYPYIAASNGLAATVPEWAQAGGTDAMLRRFHDPAPRARIVRELKANGARSGGRRGHPARQLRRIRR